MQDCSISITNVLEILQSCTKLLIHWTHKWHPIMLSSHVSYGFLVVSTRKYWPRYSGTSVYFPAQGGGSSHCGQPSQWSFLEEGYQGLSCNRITIQMMNFYPDGLLQDCSISCTLALEILQSCTTPLNIFQKPQSRSKYLNICYNIHFNLSNIHALIVAFRMSFE